MNSRTVAERLNMEMITAPRSIRLVDFLDDVLAQYPGWHRSEQGGIAAPDGSRWRLCMRDGLFRLTEWGMQS